MNNIIRTIIIDDERGARLELIRMLKDYPQIRVLAEASNADEAEELIGLLKPELIFLDIQMPGRSGFELLEGLDFIPMVVFVTAYDQYALKAFEVSALDYLMKPIREERFEKAMSQVVERCLGEVEPSVFVKNKTRHFLLKWSTVYLIESLDNYARLHFGKEEVLLKSSLNKLEEKLDKKLFFRANRSQIINLNEIRTITRQDSGMSITLNNGTLVGISERQAVKLKNLNQ
ncbi:LytTR family transcriptional regulator DNA-binding domain-containing protein [Pedobacter sp. PLR]|uniref:LytR/AlgR family response regulator transcription factor n=1 Tax=Pedobacter sp. PLR TaxID=2994465 RepID=UPI0022454AB3|nr:LytTR family transcriptional regulator DNA-binding domain-containing protein [Pedobacter sp. PLR]MCX2453177.1 LytTR family transcriptional regulator DNA-binding domain-containing protein [Pedobacter sp. PLR]